MLLHCAVATVHLAPLTWTRGWDCYLKGARYLGRGDLQVAEEAVQLVKPMGGGRWTELACGASSAEMGPRLAPGTQAGCRHSSIACADKGHVLCKLFSAVTLASSEWREID